MLTSSNAQPKPQPGYDGQDRKAAKTQQLKLVVFAIGSLNLALPIDIVVKIANLSAVHGSGLHSVGLTHIDDRAVTVVDLHQQLFKTPSQTTVRYILMGQNDRGDLFGIPVNDTPSLMEVPLTAIRQLPETYRSADTLRIADRVAVVTQKETSTTIFLLDLNCLIPATQ